FGHSWAVTSRWESRRKKDIRDTRSVGRTFRIVGISPEPLSSSLSPSRTLHATYRRRYRHVALSLQGAALPFFRFYNSIPTSARKRKSDMECGGKPPHSRRSTYSLTPYR
ncbi:MAG TPA: hypothetical protein VHS06_03390, partial [Chloroflexota bacterium]|nr:hypothetical protein [Chloroflexota bacterium]